MKLQLEKAYSARGANMGRPNEIPEDYAGEKLRLERLRFVDQCYDQGGAYWGTPANVWLAWGNTATARVRIFVRASDRVNAKVRVRRTLNIERERVERIRAINLADANLEPREPVTAKFYR